MEGHPIIEALRGLFHPETTVEQVTTLITNLALGSDAPLEYFTEFIGHCFNRTNEFANVHGDNVLYISGEINLSKLPDGRLIRRFDINVVGDGHDAVADRIARGIMAMKSEMNKNNPAIGRRSNTTRAPFEMAAMRRDALYELFANQLIHLTPETRHMVPRIAEVYYQPSRPVNRYGTRESGQIIFIYDPMPELLIRTLVVPVTAEQIFPNVMQIAENLKLLQATHQFVHRNLNAAFVFQNHALINLRDSVIHINDMVLYGFGNFNRLPADSFPFEDLYMFIATLYSHLMHIVHLRPMERQSVKLAPSGYQLLNAFFGGSGPIQSNISTRIQAPQLHSRLDRIFKLKNIRRANNGAFFAAHLDYFNRFVPTEFLTEFNEMNLEDLPEEEAEEEAEEAAEEVLEAPLPEPLVSVSPEPEPEPEPSPIVVPPRVYRNAPPEPRAYNSYERGNRGRRSRSRSRNRRNEKGHNRERSRNRRNNRGNERGTRNRRNNRGNERGTRNRRGRGNGRGRRK